MQFLREGVRLGQRVLYVTLSETLEELSDVATSHHWTLDGIDLFELDSLSDRFEQRADYTVFHPSDVELEDTVNRIRAEVERLNPDRVALDSVSELKILSQTSACYRREILGLKQFFAGRDCTVLVLDDCTTGESEQQLQSIAHGVLRMEREPREYGPTRRQIQVVKMRGVQFQDGRHDFIIKSGGLELYPRLSASGTPLINTVKKVLQLADQITMGKMAPRAITLEDVGKAKVIFEAYIRSRRKGSSRKRWSKSIMPLNDECPSRQGRRITPEKRDCRNLPLT